MRNPVRTETDAFHIAVGLALVLAASLLLGALLGPFVGLALFAGAVLGVVVALKTKRRAPAGIAGFLAALTFLVRPDGILVVLLALGMCALLVGLRDPLDHGLGDLRERPSDPFEPRRVFRRV